MTETNPRADRLEAAARRALESLNDLILDSRYPGPEAIAARYELEQVLLTSSAGPAPAADPAERRDRWETQYARYDAHDYRDLAAIGMAIADAEHDGMRAAIERLRGELKTPAAPSVSADADLRYQVLHALDFAYCNGIGYETPEQLLDAYDAHRPVLPAPADRAALSDAERTMLAYALDQAQEKIWSEGGFTDEDQAAVTSLRRLADEAQQAETQAAADCPYGAGPGDGSGCIKPAGHDGDHVVTAGVTVMPCSRAVLHSPHLPHSWWPQPGMAYVNCPGATTAAQQAGEGR